MDKLAREVEGLIRQLTLEEKASLCSGRDFWYLKGVKRLGIPPVMVTDGPHGLRKQAGDSDQLGIHDSVGATCFPTAVGLAATWDRELLREIGQALARECLQHKVAVLLGPGINIKRSPLGGRNFEYYSEDPYLTGELAVAFIQGVQSLGVGTSLKHYAVNNQETRRMTIDAVVDQRALREVYLAGFEKAVRQAQPWTVMCAYNKVNGTYASEHRELLRDILKEEWGHQGLVVSDWGATNDRIRGLAAGLELEMPSSHGLGDREIVAAVGKGQLSREILDDAVGRILTLILRARESQRENYTFDCQAHHRLARKAAAQSMVLLKNDGPILPLARGENIAIIGELARVPRYQGAGSSLVNPLKLVTAWEGLATRRETIRYAQGYNLEDEDTDSGLVAEAVALAQSADKVVLFAGLPEAYESEGFDRKNLALPASHNELIEAVAQANENIIVVLFNGAPVTMPWLDKVRAVVEAYLPGQAGGEAIWDVLYGEENPSGKLAETFPKIDSDCPASLYFPMGPTAVEYRESIYVGYRYYDTAGLDVLFPFGHGLSYTTFAYRDLKLSKVRIRDTEDLRVACTITNSGNRPGQEVVQLYVRDKESSIFRPDKELKGFAKVHLAPGEQRQVEFVLDKRAFAYYNTVLKDWQAEGGEFEVLVGASSRDIRLRGSVWVEPTREFDEQINDRRTELPSYYKPGPGWQVSKEEFETLLGRKIVHPAHSRKGAFHINSTISEIRSTVLGKLLYRVMLGQMKKLGVSDEKTRAMYIAVINEMPLRSLVMASGGKLDKYKLEGLVMMLNGRYFRAICRLAAKTKL